ncbi:MAG: hypothetical protein HY787_04030 [Deltaproteobacteria bacterium]|nr:hypothetical protein [Deltaproteobacteria bacterium]
MTTVNILAVLLSPLIALLVTVHLQNRKQKRAHKLWIFNTLIATRHSPLIEANVRALNMIDVAFYDRPKVRELWHDYFDMLSNEGLDNELGWKQRQKKNLEMITEIGRVLGYGKAITHLDVDRVYYPKGLGIQVQKAADIVDELHRVLKASGGVQFAPRSPDDSSWG